MAGKLDETLDKAAGGEGEGATAVQAPPQPARPVRKPRRLPPFKVLLHNDDVNTFEYVVKSVMKLTGMPLEEAFEKTLEAHNHRVALLMVTHRERAELVQEQFTSLRLTVTIEPDRA